MCRVFGRMAASGNHPKAGMAKFALIDTACNDASGCLIGQLCFEDPSHRWHLLCTSCLANAGSGVLKVGENGELLSERCQR